MSKTDSENETTESTNHVKIETHYTLASRSNGDAAADAASIGRRPLDTRAPRRVTL